MRSEQIEIFLFSGLGQAVGRFVDGKKLGRAVRRGDVESVVQLSDKLGICGLQRESSMVRTWQSLERKALKSKDQATIDRCRAEVHDIISRHNEGR